MSNGISTHKKSSRRGSKRERPDLAPALAKEVESEFRGVDDGRSHRVDELKACGNGIVPAVLAEFLQRVLR